MKKNNDTFNWDILYAALTSDPDPAVQEEWIRACREDEQYLLLYKELRPHFEQADEPEWADLSLHLDRINRLHHSDSQPVGNSRVIAITKRWWWFAAVTVGIGIITFFAINRFHTEKSPPISWKLVKAAEGKVTLLHFPDGSVISLSPASVIRYPGNFDTKKREVFLSGEAYFTIARDSTRPFYVHCGPISTKVTGTAFSVKGDSTSGEYEVRLVEGSVSLLQGRTQDKELLGNLLPKQAFYYHQQRDNWHIEPMTERETAAVAGGGFVFKNMPLWKIAGLLERYYAVSIGFSKPAVQQLEFTAIFERPTLSDILQVIAASRKVKITRRQDMIIFSPKN